MEPVDSYRRLAAGGKLTVQHRDDGGMGRRENVVRHWAPEGFIYR